MTRSEKRRREISGEGASLEPVHDGSQQQATEGNMTKKYRVTLEVDSEWIKNFDLSFDADSEQEAEAQALTEVKMNLSDYITAYAEEVEEATSDGKQQATSDDKAQAHE